MCKELIYRQVTFDSGHYYEGNKNSPTFHMKQKDGFSYLHSYRVRRAQIPISFHDIESWNGYFGITNAAPASSVLISIPEGNYSGSDMATEIQTQLVAWQPAEGWTCTYDSKQRRFIFNKTNSSSVTFNDTTQHTGIPAGITKNQLLWEKLGGLDNSQSEVITLGGGSGSWTMVNVYCVGRNYFHICCDELSRNNWTSVLPDQKSLYYDLSGSLTNKNRYVKKHNGICIIDTAGAYDPNNFLQQRDIIFENKSEEKWQTRMTDLKKLTFYIEDENGFQVDFHGCHWNITIDFWFQKMKNKDKGLWG